MPIGWIRAYGEEDKAVGSKNPYAKRQKRAEFRQAFRTVLRAKASENSAERAKLRWGDTVELPEGLTDGKWIRATLGNDSGFLQAGHVIELAYVGRKTGRSDRSFSAKLDYKHFDRDTGTEKPATKELLWGDPVQILSRRPQRCEVRVRGFRGKMDTEDLVGKGLLEAYFIDVGQGDGVLVCTPDFRHLLIDGGLERSRQQTGKNAADLVDWKFFIDYGDHRIRLASLMASHSDSDHYGGLHDLVRISKMADRELDCLGVDIDTFHHPGLSRWSHVKNAVPPHADGLGPKLGQGFIRLLGDRADADNAVNAGTNGKLSGPWGRFVRDVLKNSKKTKVEPVLVAREHIRSGKPPPLLWKASEGCLVEVLAPVTYLEQGHVALRDLGKKSINTNGHSICLRLKYGKARILLTGDLNTKSMNWLEDCYDERISLFKCDVAKACHHGSHDISYRFLEAINAAATVISSGDAEGYSHPRPEVVAASACSGFKEVDRRRDRLVTPLIYMTEIQRSVTLGAINRVDIKAMPVANGRADGILLGRPLDELDDKGFLSPADRKSLHGLDDKAEEKALRAARKAAKPILKAMEADTEKGNIRVDFNLTVPYGPVHKENVGRRGWRARLMQKTLYGMVTVRTDGDVVMCATLDETGKDWTIHTFDARFPA